MQGLDLAGFFGVLQRGTRELGSMGVQGGVRPREKTYLTPPSHGHPHPNTTGTNVMKFGHALQDVPSHVDGKGGFDDMKLESGGQRLSADDYDFDPEDEDEGLNPTEEGSRFKGKSKWVKRVGAFLFMIGGVLNFVSFSYAAQSLLASLGSVQVRAGGDGWMSEASPDEGCVRVTTFYS